MARVAELADGRTCEHDITVDLRIPRAASTEEAIEGIARQTVTRTGGALSGVKGTVIGTSGDSGGSLYAFEASVTKNSGSTTAAALKVGAGFDSILDLSAQATGESDIVVADNLASALQIRESSNAYLTIVTTNSSEAVKVDKTLDQNAIIDHDVALTAAGDGQNTAVTINHATAVVTGHNVSAAQLTTPRTGGTVTGVKSSVTSLSGDTAGVDYYAFEAAVTAGEAGADHFAFKVGAGFDAAIDLSSVATGEADIVVADNLASALEVREGSNTFLKVVTTNSAEHVEVTGLRCVQGTAVAITGVTALTLKDAGGIFSVSQAAAYDIDLPSPTSGPGCRYLFYLTGPAANAVTITVAGAAATFVGTIVNDVTSVIPATGSTLTFASGAAALGDTIEIISISTTLYLVRAVTSAAGGITIA